MRPPIERELSTHFAALRGLARDLVGEGDADDLVQDAAMQALRRPPAEPGPLLGWLRVVVRRLATRHRLAARRRAGRERAVARDEVVPAPQQQVEHREQLQRLTAAVLGLSEPYQRTVLQRYLEELTPTQIAARDGVPIATVKSRLQRGLSLLRERLDAEDQGKGEWRALLAGAFGLSKGAAVAAGVVVMGTGVKVAIGGAAAVAIAVAAWWLADAAVPTAPPVTVAPQDNVPVASAGSATAAATETAPATDRQELAPTPATANSAVVTVHGRCIAAETGAPLAGCRVTLDDVQQTPPATVTGSDGAFTFAIAPPAKAELRVEWHADARLYRFQDVREVAAGKDLDLGDVSLQRGAKVQGAVVDGAGAPVPEVQVGLQGLPIPIPVRGGCEHRASGAADGSFAFEAIPAGTWPLAIHSPGHVLAEPHVVAVPPDLEPVTVRIVLAAAPSIAGSVVDESGKPVSGAVLGFESPSYVCTSAPSRADGSFELFALRTDPPPGRVLLDNAKGFEASPLTDVVTWGTRDLRLVLQRALQLTVHVTELGSGAPVERFAVVAARPGNPHVPRHGDFPMADAPGGRRTLTEFPRGSFRVAAFADDRALLPSPWTTVDAAQTSGTLELTVERLEPLTARVHDAAGAPVADVRLELVQLGDGNFGSWAMDPWDYRGNYIEQGPPGSDRPLVLSKASSGADGSALLYARFAPSPHGLELRVRGTRIEPFQLRDPLLVRGQPLDITVQPNASLRGVVHVRGYAPGSVYLVAEYYTDPAMTSGGKTLRVGADGSFAFAGLQSGNYRIWFASAQGDSYPGKHAPALALLTLRPGEQQTLDLDAHRFDAVRIGGRILVDGAPLSAPRVQLDFHGGWRRIGPIQGNPDGSFQVDSLPPGPYAVGFLVDEQGSRLFVPQDEPFTATAGASIERDFHITRRSLCVRVLDAEGRAVADREVVLQQKDEDPRKQRTDATGTATFAWAPPGALTVTSTGLPVETVTFAAGEPERTVDLRPK